MDFFHAIILSIIEGLTEFLPISSTGHMILAADLLSIPESEFLKSFEVIIQMGAILAVVVIYFKTLITKKSIMTRLIVAFIPTGIVGFLLYKLIKEYLLGNSQVVLWSLFVGGIILIIWERYYKGQKHHIEEIEKLSHKKAFVIGLFQSLSVIPGTSRAAATIVGGLIMGLDRRRAVEFSFLLAVPTMIAATGLDLIESSLSFSNYEWMLLGTGFVGAFITAIISIKFFLRFVKNHTFAPFGVYRIILALTLWSFVVR